MQQEDRFEGNCVERLKLEIGYANLTIGAADGEEIIVRLDAEDNDSNYKCSLKENHKLHVAYEAHKVNHIERKTENNIAVLIPKQKSFQKVKIRLGAGETVIEEGVLSSEKLSLEVGAAKLDSGAICVHNTMEVEVGAGKVKLESLEAGAANIQCGVGKLYMSGNVHSNLNVDCGVGTVDVDLDAKEQDYNYEVSCALGKVELNHSSIGRGISNKSVSHADSVGTVTLNCGLGKIAVNTLG